MTRYFSAINGAKNVPVGSSAVDGSGGSLKAMSTATKLPERGGIKETQLSHVITMEHFAIPQGGSVVDINFNNNQIAFAGKTIDEASQLVGENVVYLWVS